MFFKHSYKNIFCLMIDNWYSAMYALYYVGFCRTTHHMEICCDLNSSFPFFNWKEEAGEELRGGQERLN